MTWSTEKYWLILCCRIKPGDLVSSLGLFCGCSGKESSEMSALQPGSWGAMDPVHHVDGQQEQSKGCAGWRGREERGAQGGIRPGGKREQKRGSRGRRQAGRDKGKQKGRRRTVLWGNPSSHVEYNGVFSQQVSSQQLGPACRLPACRVSKPSLLTPPYLTLPAVEKSLAAGPCLKYTYLN